MTNHHKKMSLCLMSVENVIQSLPLKLFNYTVEATIEVVFNERYFGFLVLFVSNSVVLKYFLYNSPVIPSASPFSFPSCSGDENNSIHIKLEEERDGALVSHMCH